MNDYRQVQFLPGNSVLSAAGTQVQMDSTNNLDDFIQSCERRIVPPEGISELFHSGDRLVPIVFKVRGSQDCADSCAISTTHFFEVARAITLEGRLLDPITTILKNTPIVFLGTGILTPEFRLVEHTLLRDALPSGYGKYMCQLPPFQELGDCFRQMEHRIWPQIKTRAQAKGVTILETRDEDFLAALKARCEAALA